ncbi:unnamed protein product, partial [Ectocarpus sp. 4 AP-2014]
MEKSVNFRLLLLLTHLVRKVDGAGGGTQLSTTPSLDTDSPANASLFCYNDGDPSGTTLGPYPSEGRNPDTSAEITASSCDD